MDDRARWTRRGGLITIRFWSKVAVTDDDSCWEWQGGQRGDGYGEFWSNGKMGMAHRTAYALTYGDIPEGQCVCHQCDNPRCCNPEHLFLGTADENVADKVAKGRQARQPGQQNPNALLTDEQAEKLRAEYQRGGVSQRALAAAYGIRQATVWGILAGRSYRGGR